MIPRRRRLQNSESYVIVSFKVCLLKQMLVNKVTRTKKNCNEGRNDYEENILITVRNDSLKASFTVETHLWLKARG